MRGRTQQERGAGHSKREGQDTARERGRTQQERGAGHSKREDQDTARDSDCKSAR